MKRIWRKCLHIHVDGTIWTPQQASTKSPKFILVPFHTQPNPFCDKFQVYMVRKNMVAKKKNSFNSSTLENYICTICLISWRSIFETWTKTGKKKKELKEMVNPFMWKSTCWESKPRVYNIINSINYNRCLCNIGGKHHFNFL
jgi:hypothetical protein